MKGQTFALELTMHEVISDLTAFSMGGGVGLEGLPFHGIELADVTDDVVDIML